MNATGCKTRAVGRHGQVTLRHQLAPRSRRHALHPRNDRHAELVDGQHHAAALRKQLLVVRQLGVRRHVLEVVARAKRLAGCRQHHHTHRLVAARLVQRLLQRREHLAAQRIEAGGVVQGQGHHAACVAGNLQQIMGIRHHSSPVFCATGTAEPGAFPGHCHQAGCLSEHRWHPGQGAYRSARTRRCASTLRASGPIM